MIAESRRRLSELHIFDDLQAVSHILGANICVHVDQLRLRHSNSSMNNQVIEFFLNQADFSIEKKARDEKREKSYFNTSFFFFSNE